MRNMSFGLTKEQILNQTKTVTRRFGWAKLKQGDLVQPVDQVMGFKRGETGKKLGCPIKIISNWPEILSDITDQDVLAEGFPGTTRMQFVQMFSKKLKCDKNDIVNRIAFRYMVPK